MEDRHQIKGFFMCFSGILIGRYLAYIFDVYTKLGGGFKYVLLSPLPGEMIQFDSYFSNGLKPPTRKHTVNIL